MEEDLQKTTSSNDKKPAFLSKPVDKKMLIIIACSLLCLFLVVLLFSFIGGSSRKAQIQSSSRPSIHAPKKAPRRNIEKPQQPEETQQIQTQTDQTDKMQQRFMERKKRMVEQQSRRQKGKFKNETLEEEHQRHLREEENGIAYGLGDYDEQERRYSRTKREKSSQRTQQKESERPKLNS